MAEWIWLVPVLPFVGALLNGVVLHDRIGKRAVGWIACGSVAASLVLGGAAIADYLGGPLHAAGEAYEKVLYTWVPAGSLALADGRWSKLTVEMGFQLDALSAVMVLVVTFVGLWIHVYSVGYMAKEGGYQRYFTYLNLFMGAMLLLVLGNNFLVLFVGWEGVGLCSYLLIGFYYDEEFPPYAGRKAFIVNRVGDFAFLVGMLALVAAFGTLDYGEIFGAVAADRGVLEGGGWLGLSVGEFVALCLLVGAVGKSAQIPLYVWLPDAMAGPTPVSALIHAATMVTAGVYMVVRANAIYQVAEGVSGLVAVVGALTALMAATIGLAQTDIKKVLAYSTVSQLGYMFLAAGVGAYGAAIFHLGTHAFFKALLFLGSGSVIHALRGEQDMRRMGGLRGALPVTYWTFLVGTLALAGIPPLAGFFSKDQILSAAFAGHKVLWGVGLVTAGLTAFYMTRALRLTFFGAFRGGEEAWAHVHESPRVMTVPLVVLSAGAVGAGFLGVPVPGWNRAVDFVEGVVVEVGGGHGHHAAWWVEVTLMALSVAVALGGLVWAWRLYGEGLAGGERWARRFPRIHRLLVNKYYVDEFYDATVVAGTWAAARGLHRFDAAVIDGFGVNGTGSLTRALALLSGFFDKYFVDGLVNGVGRILLVASRAVRGVQSGSVSRYAMVMAAGVFALVCMVLWLRAG